LQHNPLESGRGRSARVCGERYRLAARIAMLFGR